MAVVPQKSFSTLEEFIAGQNNFYGNFLAGNPWGEIRRERAYFQRFMELYPELEQEVTRLTVEAKDTSTRLPFEKLFNAYGFMAVLVYDDDPDVMRYPYPESYLVS